MRASNRGKSFSHFFVISHFFSVQDIAFKTTSPAAARQDILVLRRKNSKNAAKKGEYILYTQTEGGANT